MLKIILTAISKPLIEAWHDACGDLDCVEIIEGSILNAEADALVSPANSFGFMDGGLDRLYTAHFGVQLQRRLQDLIRDRHHGELLVGKAEILEIGAPSCARFLISAPTMRIPRILKDTVNPYLAARAALLCKPS